MLLTCAAGAQNLSQPVLTAGIFVKMAISRFAVPIPAADGKVCKGTRAAEPETLGELVAGSVYVKADARAPFGRVLAVLESLRGKRVALLTAPPT